MRNHLDSPIIVSARDKCGISVLRSSMYQLIK